MFCVGFSPWFKNEKNENNRSCMIKFTCIYSAFSTEKLIWHLTCHELNIYLLFVIRLLFFKASLWCWLSRFLLHFSVFFCLFFSFFKNFWWNKFYINIQRNSFEEWSSYFERSPAFLQNGPGWFISSILTVCNRLITHDASMLPTIPAKRSLVAD